MDVKAFNNLCPQDKAFPGATAALQPLLRRAAVAIFLSAVGFQRRQRELAPPRPPTSPPKAARPSLEHRKKKKGLDSFPPCLHFNFISSPLPLFSALLINSQPAAIWVKVGSKREERETERQKKRWNDIKFVSRGHVGAALVRFVCLELRAHASKPSSRAEPRPIDFISPHCGRTGMQVGLKGIVHP